MAKLSAARRMEAMKEAAEKGYEAEDYEQLEEELENEEELMTNLVDACGYMLKTHKENFLPAFDAFVGVTFARYYKLTCRPHYGIMQCVSLTMSLNIVVQELTNT